MTLLRGITWDHPRGYQGLCTATESYHALRADVRIEWEKHSLHHFESHPIADLADKYDFIVLDHPFMGDAYVQQCLIDLSEYAVQIGIEDLSSDVVGQSYESYLYGDGLWAIPLDASCQMAPYRPDLLNALDESAPTTLAEMRNLAKKGPLCYRTEWGPLVHTLPSHLRRSWRGAKHDAEMSAGARRGRVGGA